MLKIIHRFFYAWLFLTKLPAPPLPRATKEDWGRIAPYFVLIGFILGLILFYAAKTFSSIKLPVLFSALLVLLLWVLITGALHLDGVFDTFDGIGCQDKERKIEAIRDSRIGAFGAMGGIFVILFKLITLGTIILNKMFFVILFALPLSRLAAVYSFTFLKKSTQEGKGYISSSYIIDGVKKPFDFLFNLLLFSTFLVVLNFFFKLSFLFFLFISFIISLLWSYWLHHHFKGHSGDTYGALIELSEVTILSLAVVFKNYLLGLDL